MKKLEDSKDYVEPERVPEYLDIATNTTSMTRACGNGSVGEKPSL